MADPLSVAGLALGSASILFQVFAGVTQGIRFMLDVKEVPEEYQTLRFRLTLEQTRLSSWGKAVGLDMDEPAAAITIPDQVRYLAQGHMEPLLLRIQRFISESPSFDTSSYETDRKDRQFRSKIRDTIHKAKDQVKWVTFRMSELEDLVECARHVNDTVIALSELKTQQKIYEEAKATNMALLEVRNTVGGLKEMIEALGVNNAPGLVSNQTEDLLRDLAQLKKQRLQAQADVDRPISAGDESSFKLPRDRVQTLDEEELAMSRWDAEVGDKPGYWVEFKRYPQPSQPSRPTKDELERLVVRELAMLLHLKLPPSFRVPRCVGYYDHDGAFGLLFEKPHKDASIVALSHCLEQETSQPDLESRLALARAVAETVCQLHAVDWLHKALRANNILLFEQPDKPIAYAEPCVSGFELARPASQPNLTQAADPGGEDDDFYRHPNNRLCNPGHRSHSYCKEFDLYSLGILLIEIALWSPIKQVVGAVGANKPGEVTEHMLNESDEIMGKVRFAMGTSFAGAVSECLQGLGSRGESESYVVSFERLVVKMIRGITVSG
ncbi:hypothetical protein Neosp_004062 [[Neocosmospora] mangrovei]